MIDRQPLNLTTEDFIESRNNNYHARWPRDPDTTRRLDAVRNLDLSADYPRVTKRWALKFQILFWTIASALAILIYTILV